MRNCNSLSLCQVIWPNLQNEAYGHQNYTSTLKFLETQEEIISKRQLQCAHMGVIQFVALISQFSRDRDATNSAKDAAAKVRAVLGDTLSEQQLSECLEQALRIMLTIDIRSTPSSSRPRNQTSLATSVNWDQDSTLTDAIEAFFANQVSPQLDTANCRIPASFSIPNICKYRRYRVLWTSNLAEHLTIDWRFRTITIYKHKIFLWNHLKNTDQTIIPRPILEEAIDTLNVLFPLHDDLTSDFLNRHAKGFNGAGYCARSRSDSLYLARFHVWKSKMADLMEIMNEEPRGLRQLALESDGRNLLPFLAFWVAIAVAVLSILGLVFAIVSMKYTIKQYELSLAQACSTPGANESLPQYCN